MRLVSSKFLAHNRAGALADRASGPVESLSLVSAPRTHRVIRLVALICALIFGHASIAGTAAAPDVARASQSSDPATKVDRGAPDPQAHVAQPEKVSRHRSLKRHRVSTKIALWHNPDCDDETSNDSDDDDDTSNDLNRNDDETDLPIVFWLQDMVRYLIALEAESVLAWTESPSSPFRTLQRLRC
jgi:hypothetical protein